ncbi:hypothetical protein WDU94_012042 [Cyamophila willieti]
MSVIRIFADWDQRRTCNADGQWDIPEYGYTECLRLVEYEAQTAYSSLGLTLIILVPLLLLLCCIGHRLHHRIRSNKSLTWNSAQTLRRRKSVQSLASLDQMLSKSQSLNDPVTPIEYSPSEILYNDDKRKFRFYERSYRTNEPLPDKPDINWGDVDITSTDERDEYPVLPSGDGNVREYPEVPHGNPGEDNQEEFSVRTFGKSLPIILIIILPLFICLICVGYKILVKQVKDNGSNSSGGFSSFRKNGSFKRPTITPPRITVKSPSESEDVGENEIRAL